jgi:hypothetical protein
VQDVNNTYQSILSPTLSSNPPSSEFLPKFMTSDPLIGVLLILILCPLIGFLKPLWLKPLWQNETLWAVLQGLTAVGIARIFFSGVSEWHLVALMSLVVGQSIKVGQRQDGQVNLWSIFAGYGLHEPVSAGLVALLSGVGVMCFRTERQSLVVVLSMLPIVTALRYPWNSSLIVMTMFLSGLVYLIYDKAHRTRGTRSDAETAQLPETELKFFRADAAVVTLDDRLLPIRVGQPAALLSELRRDGYSVPDGWLVYPGDDLETVIALAEPTPQLPAIVRYSHLKPQDPDQQPDKNWEAKGESELRGALVQAFDGTEASVIMVQSKIWTVFSGTVREVVPGYLLVTSGEERFEVRSNGTISANVKSYDTPDRLIQEVADLLRQVQQSDSYQKQLGNGFAIEWIHDGEKLWIWDIRRK